jgi:hypothetical protein
MSKSLDSHNTRRVAVAAGCDPSSIGKYLRGELKRGSLHFRISTALHELQLDSMVRPEPGIHTQETSSLDFSPGSKA